MTHLNFNSRLNETMNNTLNNNNIINNNSTKILSSFSPRKNINNNQILNKTFSNMQRYNNESILNAMNNINNITYDSNKIIIPEISKQLLEKLSEDNLKKYNIIQEFLINESKNIADEYNLYSQKKKFRK